MVNYHHHNNRSSKHNPALSNVGADLRVRPGFGVRRGAGADTQVCPGFGVRRGAGADTQVCPYNKNRKIFVPPQKVKRLASILLMIGLVIGSLFTSARQASAHEGPPYPILVDKMIGPCVVSVWADPDVGIGTYFIILDHPQGGTLPEDVTVEIGVHPVSGRLAEARYKAEREALRNRTQFKAEIPFDAEERWLTRILLKSSRGGGEATVEVDVTPPGYGRWDLLLYLFPFLAVGFLWLKAFLRRRSHNKIAK